MACTTEPSSQSTIMKNTATSATMTNTMTVVCTVSLRDGQVTLLVSCRTSRKNLAGFIPVVFHLFEVAGYALPVTCRSSRSSSAPTACLAGLEGLEPPTPGFGDRCSTN